MIDKRIPRLIAKAFASLEEGDWQKADEYCEKVLETDAENAEAYLGRLMAESEIKSRDELKNYSKPLEDSEYYHKIISNGDEELVELVKSVNDSALKAIEEKNKKIAVVKKVAKIGVPALVAAVALVVLIFTVIIPSADRNRQYKDAVELMQSGELQRAMCAFKELGDYKDSPDLLRKLRSDFAPKATISAGNGKLLALKADDKVLSVYDDGKSYTDSWSNIVAVSSGGFHAAGLKADGRVVTVGDNKYKQCDVSTWTDIISVSAGYIHTVGLKADGMVVAAGYADDARCNVNAWTDIVAVSAGKTHTVGLKADGTVVATGDNSFNQCNVSEWKDIVEVSAGEAHTVALKADGTVVVTDCSERYFQSQSAAADWTDIVAVSAGSDFTVGLKSDGTVVATGDNTIHQIDVGEWKDIVAVSAGKTFVAGLKADGTVVCTGNYVYNNGISGWNGIKLPAGSTTK